MYSYWYLLALIAWRLTAHHLAKLPRINQILTLTALLIGFFPSVDNTLAAARIVAFYPFYISGYMLNADKSDTLRLKPYAKRLTSGLISFPYARIYYAIKANPGEPVLEMLSEMGSCFDIASRYELDIISKFNE